jgi:hypothetical protein
MDVLSLVTLLSSVVSAAITIYFWFVRIRNERPDVRVFHSNSHFDIGTCRGETRFLPFRIDIIVANYSVLPNAILQGKLRWKTREGTWEEKSCSVSTMPLNIPPSQCSSISFSGTLALEGASAIEKGDDRTTIIASQLTHWFSQPMMFEVELKTLQPEPIKAEVEGRSWSAS